MERFTIAVPDSVLEDLQHRLSRARLPDQLEDAGWSYGMELSYLRELVHYWREQYDWRAQERALNRFDQFKARVRELDLCFIHQRSKEPDAFPLLITHGWPGSVFEFHKILGPLTDPVSHGGKREDAFHVVCPSMPGFGFSEAPRKPGFGIRQVAETNAALMAALGYDRYGAQGGDWGAAATAEVARIDPQHVAGIHMNMLMAGPPPDATSPTDGVAPEELAWLADMASFRKHEAGYQRIQRTKPQTVGYGLNDSPVGLAAWIVEKFRGWSDCNGDVETRFTKDELLTNVMLYWVTQSITSSMRLYCETERGRTPGPLPRVETPTAAAIFPKELTKTPRAWAEAAFNLKRFTVFASGGHFAALEEPEALVGDIRAFFREVRLKL
jgi:pimeloyl-ACP methyl ester carboxylesterase